MVYVLPCVQAGTQGRPSGVEVGDQHAFEFGDLVLEKKLALFEPLQSELIDIDGLRQRFNGSIQVAVLQTQFLESDADGLYGFVIEHDCLGFCRRSITIA